MKNSITIIILLVIAHTALAQDTVLTTLRHNLLVASDDTSRVWAMESLSDYYKLKKPDSALIYGYKALALAKKIKFTKGEFEAIVLLIITQHGLGNNSKELQLIFQAGKIAEKSNDGFEKATVLGNSAAFYTNSKDYVKALTLFKEAKKVYDSINDSIFSPFAQLGISETYLAMHQLDSALYNGEAAYKNAIQIKDNWLPQYILLQLGRIHNELGNTNLALLYFRQTLSKASNDADEVCACYLSIAQLYKKTGQQDSAIFYGEKSLELARESGFYNDIINASLLLSDIYEKKDPQQALLYSKKAINYKDSLHNMVESSTQETFIQLDDQEHLREIEEAQAEFKNRLRINAFLGISVTLFFIAILLYRSSRLKQKAKKNIEKAYHQLEATQAQLIQSEKMASLGELTAGIAHEIQNPLNFVNNFSDVNKDLIDEMQEEMDKGNFDDAKAISNDIKENEEKINHHGKRADAIVKGMLQHSRNNAGQKEPTNINALADEYLRLSYHGLRAKDKSFNASMQTDFDKNIGMINIIPQGIGRVLLNLFTNAFYSVTEKKKLQVEGYEPTVSVSTKKINDKVEITVTDNGKGIPQKILDKIYQPFFTTKLTGQGTGLGLSMSYDIIKAHGGEIKVETNEGEGSMFTTILSGF